jgi:polyisoprenoid-binding protein YceI
LHPSRHFAVWTAALAIHLAVGAQAWAKPQRYHLDAAASEVAFTVEMGQNPLSGQMPVARADLLPDFARAADSRISVTLDAAGAKMGLPFAAAAMKGDQVLDTARFPEITFTSTRLKASGQKARIAGRVTIRGITRPIILDAQLFRAQGSAEGDLDRLSVHITGSVKRSDFGASGFADTVGDIVTITIKARILRDDVN